MDKTAIKKFAVEARRVLMEDVRYLMSTLGISSDGVNEPVSSADGVEDYGFGPIFGEDILKRRSLAKEVESKGFESVGEKVLA